MSEKQTYFDFHINHEFDVLKVYSDFTFDSEDPLVKYYNLRDLIGKVNTTYEIYKFNSRAQETLFQKHYFKNTISKISSTINEGIVNFS